MSSSMIYCSCNFCGTAQQTSTTINSFVRPVFSPYPLALCTNVETTTSTEAFKTNLVGTETMTREANQRRSQQLKFGIEKILYGSANAKHLGARPTVPNPTPQGTNRRPQSLPWSRPVFTDHQRRTLENRFELQQYLNKRERYHLSLYLGLTEHQIKVWFQNRRVKFRNGQKAEKRRTRLPRARDTTEK